MTTPICGHDRETLRWALRAGEFPAFNWADRALQARWDAHESVTDPTKLAYIIAELLCAASGLTVGVQGVEDLLGQGVLLALVAPMRPVLRVTMPQARAFALALLDAPNATAQGIERMIGEL
jgi:hypothetical protein